MHKLVFIRLHSWQRQIRTLGQKNRLEKGSYGGFWLVTFLTSGKSSHAGVDERSMFIQSATLCYCVDKYMSNMRWDKCAVIQSFAMFSVGSQQSLFVC